MNIITSNMVEVHPDFGIRSKLCWLPQTQNGGVPFVKNEYIPSQILQLHRRQPFMHLTNKINAGKSLQIA